VGSGGRGGCVSNGGGGGGVAGGGNGGNGGVAGGAAGGVTGDVAGSGGRGRRGVGRRGGGDITCPGGAVGAVGDVRGAVVSVNPAGTTLGGWSSGEDLCRYFHAIISIKETTSNSAVRRGLESGIRSLLSVNESESKLGLD